METQAPIGDTLKLSTGWVGERVQRKGHAYSREKKHVGGSVSPPNPPPREALVDPIYSHKILLEEIVYWGKNTIMGIDGIYRTKGMELRREYK